jgi:hypothetical protein
VAGMVVVLVGVAMTKWQPAAARVPAVTLLDEAPV